MGRMWVGLLPAPDKLFAMTKVMTYNPTMAGLSTFRKKLLVFVLLAIIGVALVYLFNAEDDGAFKSKLRYLLKTIFRNIF